MKTTVFILAYITSITLYAQDDATLVVITNFDAIILLDGIEKCKGKAGSACRVSTTAGEHYVEALSNANTANSRKGEIVILESTKQKIIKLEIDNNIATPDNYTFPVADINFNLPGTVGVMAWKSNNPGQHYAYPEFFYAFEKGDEIILDISMSNAKGTNAIRVSTYANNVTRYTNNSFVELKDVRIPVPDRAIYKFTLSTNHAFDRNCFIRIKRKFNSPSSKEFNTTVFLKRILTPITIAEAQSFYINSGSNATFATGKSRVILPVVLPQNTVEWCYRFSASRDPKDINKVKENFKLFSEIKGILNLTGAGAIVGNFAFDKLTQPPGSDFCDIKLIPQEDGQAFENKQDDQWKYFQEGSRSNFKSGNVKVNCCNQGSYVIGLKNPDSFYGIHVLIEVVAITAENMYVMENE